MSVTSDGSLHFYFMSQMTAIGSPVSLCHREYVIQCCMKPKSCHLLPLSSLLIFLSFWGIIHILYFLQPAAPMQIEECTSSHTLKKAHAYPSKKKILLIAFRHVCKIAKSKYYFVMSVCQSTWNNSVCPSTWYNSAPNGQTFMKFDI